MGQKIIQRIVSCDCCGETPNDGEPLWEMGNENICEKCFDNGAYDEYLESKEDE